MGKIIIKQFKRYCKENFNIEDIFKQIADKRKRPQIRVQQICWAVVNMVSLRIRSLLELDQISRLPKMRRYIGTKRYMVCSDTTYDRVLNLMPTGSIRKAMVKICRQLQSREPR